jgi:GNAT superfamily N-acetyltransferase
VRDLRPLTADTISDLAAGAELCTFWQTVPHNGHVRSTDPSEVAAAWVREVTGDWGPPGRVVYVDGRAVGYVLLAPARLVPRLAAFATAPSDPTTLMLLTVRVEEDQLGHGLRKVLVQAAVKDALRHRVRSIDAIAARPMAVTKDPCVLEAAFLEKVGFRVTRDHPLYPRLRLDLRTVVTIRDGATAAVQRVLAKVSGVRPVPETHPDGATRARAADQP